jgi:ABC-type amino acid transport substrate-binding protein
MIIKLVAFFIVTNITYATQSVFNSNENLIEQKIAEIILAEILKPAGINIKVKPLPPSRANEENVNLSVDGEIARISSYQEKNPSLKRVDPPYYYLATAVFCSDPKKNNFKNKDDIRNSSVATIRGVAHSDAVLVGHPKILSIDSAHQMFELLNAKRVDIAIDTLVNGQKIILNKKFSGIKVCGIIARHDLHIYLNKRSDSHYNLISKAIKNYSKNKGLLLTEKSRRLIYLKYI